MQLHVKGGKKTFRATIPEVAALEKGAEVLQDAALCGFTKASAVREVMMELIAELQAGESADLRETPGKEDVDNSAVPPEVDNSAAQGALS